MPIIRGMSIFMDKYSGRTPGQWISHLKSSGAPKKLIDQVKAIEDSGKKFGRSREYVIRTILSKIPQKYQSEPIAIKSFVIEPINKKSVELSSEEYKSIEDIILKIAGANDIANVSHIDVHVTNNDCVVRFSCENTKEVALEK